MSADADPSPPHPDAEAAPGRPAMSARALRITRAILTDAAAHFMKDAGLIMGSAIAFSSIFALFPFLIFLITLGGLVGQTDAAQRAIDIAFDVTPPAVVDALSPVVQQVVTTPRTGLMTLSIVLSLWLAVSALETLRHAVDLAYDCEPRHAIWLRWLQSLAFTIVAAIAILVVMILIVVGPIVLDLVVTVFEIKINLSWTHTLLQHGTAVALMLVVTAALYYWLPSRPLALVEILPGAAVAVVTWIVAAAIFSIYLRYMGRFSVIYGSLGGIVITLFFMELSALIFVFGAEINGAIHRARRGAARAGQSHL